MGTHMSWGAVEPKRAAPIPEAFEPTLESVLRHKYLDENWGLPEVHQYILDRYHLDLSSRQLTYRLRKYGILKSDHTIRPQPTTNVQVYATQPVTCNIPANPINDRHANIYINHTSSGVSQLPVDCPPSAFDHSPPLTHVTGPTQCLTEALNILPDLETERSPLGFRFEGVNTRANGSEHGASDTGKIWHPNSVRQSPSMGSSGQMPEHPSREPDFQACDRMVSAISHTRIKFDGIDTKSYEVPSNRRSLGDTKSVQWHSSVQPLVLRMTDGPNVSTTTLAERLNAIMGTLLGRLAEDPKLLDASVWELLSSMRFALATLCCGYSTDASRILESLLWWWHARGAVTSEVTGISDPFLNLMWALKWLLQTSLCDVSDLTCVRLWHSCRDAHMDRNRHLGRVGVVTPDQILAVGRLALAAYAQDYSLLFKELQDFWNIYGGADVARKFPYIYQTIAFNFIDKKITDWQSIGPPRSWNYKNVSRITAGIELLLLWMDEQLSYGWAYGNIDFEAPWRQCYPSEYHGNLRQQQLLGFLSYQGSRGKLPGRVLLSSKDCQLLPWNICLEWLLDEFPYLTLSILSSLVEESPSHATPSERWRQRMQIAVTVLLADLEGTVARFCTVAAESCPDLVQQDLSGRRIMWISPIRLKIHETSEVSGKDLTELAQHLAGNAALFGDSVPLAKQEHLPTMITNGYDPPLLNTPKSSLSGLESMKLTHLRGINETNRCHKSPSACSSTRLRRLSLARSSTGDNWVEAGMNWSQKSFPKSPSFSQRNDRQDESTSIIDTDVAMAIGTWFSDDMKSNHQDTTYEVGL